ncbi:MAG: hypothetical protein ACRDZ8_15850 [Acidimicrobiales bacterium]
MSSNQVRVTVSGLYAIAILAALLIVHGTAFIVVVIVGAMVVALVYAVTTTRTPR